MNHGLDMLQLDRRRFAIVAAASYATFLSAYGPKRTSIGPLKGC